MFNATAPDHTPTAINDTTMLRFHIAILKIRDTYDEDHRPLQVLVKGMAYTRITIMREANARVA